MPAPTTRLGLAQYADTEAASFSAQINAISTVIDAKACIFLKGTFAGRPAAGIEGRYYLAENGTLSGCSEGDLYYDTGTVWVGPRNMLPSGPPLGGMMDHSLNADPVDPDGVTRWMIANGRALLRATYAALFAKYSAIGLSVWGAGNGSTTFNIPNMPGKIAVHPGGSGVTTVGSTGGEQTHTLTTAEVAAHEHVIQMTNGFEAGSGQFHVAVQEGVLVSNFQNTQATGGGGTHNNMQPYVGMYKIIRVL